MGNRWMGTFKKVCLIMGVGICMSGGPAVPAMAKQVGTFEGHPVFDNKISDVKITGGSENAITRQGATGFPSKYDPRNTHKVSLGIEDQGESNTCWAFATAAAMESNLIKNGYATEDINLSENHIAYFFYNRQKDPIGYTAGDANKNRQNSWDMNGGNLWGTAIALTTWAGVVKEPAGEDVQGVYVPKALPAKDCYKADYRVANTYFYEYHVNTVKQAILDYGAVATGMYLKKEYYNPDDAAYNYISDKNSHSGEMGHAVTIVGWDDNFSRNNFNLWCRPKSNGAWIVKNSYGTEFGEGGYWYISYEDKSLAEIVAYDMAPASQTYDHNYQYDGSANPIFALQFKKGGGTIANVFKAKGSGKGYNEELKAVGIQTFTEGAEYSLQIYTGVTSSTNPTKGKKMFSKPQKGVLKNAGYNQIVLNQPITLTAGEKYSVVITLDAGVTNSLQVGLDTSYTEGWIQFVAKVGKGQSFTKAGGKWYDMGKTADITKIAGFGTPVSNWRIKAYTDDTNQKTSYKLNTKSLSISKGSSASLSLKIKPAAVKRTITWSSSNKKVATVSSSGKVKGKAYGTAVIKAKFVAGSKTKTLTCKVTVGPSKVKGMKVKGSKKKITVTWKKNSKASGYVIYYSQKKDSGYKTLGTIKKNSKVKFKKGKLKAGTYYVKMRPYLSRNGKKLYGSYTAVKSVEVK